MEIIYAGQIYAGRLTIGSGLTVTQDADGNTYLTGSGSGSGPLTDSPAVGYFLRSTGAGGHEWAQTSTNLVQSLVAGTAISVSAATGAVTVNVLAHDIVSLHTTSGRTTGQILRAASATTLGWSTATYPATAAAGDVMYASATNTFASLAIGTVGRILRSTGTLPAWTTATFPDTATAGQLLYASASNIWSALGIGGAGTVLRSTGSLPAWATLAKADLPSAIAYEDEVNTFTTTNTFQQNTTFGSSIFMDQPAGFQRVIFWRTGTTPRWALYANSDAESGSNTGSTLTFSRYNDAGAFIDSPLLLLRTNGVVGILNDLWVNNSTVIRWKDGISGTERAAMRILSTDDWVLETNGSERMRVTETGVTTLTQYIISSNGFYSGGTSDIGFNSLGSLFSIRVGGSDARVTVDSSGQLFALSHIVTNETIRLRSGRGIYFDDNTHDHTYIIEAVNDRLDFVVGGFTVLQLTGTTATFIGDVVIGSLGRFDSTDTPTDREFMVYNATDGRWRAETIQFTFGNSDIKNIILGTWTATYIFKTQTAAASDGIAPPAPVVRLYSGHNSITVHILGDSAGTAYAKPADFSHFDVRISTDVGFGTYQSVLSTSDKVVFGRLTNNTTYYVLVYAVDQYSNYNAAPMQSIAPVDSEVTAFGVILASEIGVVSLSAINASIGHIQTGQVSNVANTAGLFIDSWPGASVPPVGWTRYISLVGTGSDKFIMHENFELRHDGLARLKSRLVSNVTTPNGGSVTDNVLKTHTIPAGYEGINGGLHVVAHFVVDPHAGGGNVTFKIKLGGTVITTKNVVVPTSAPTRQVRVDCYIFNEASVSAQRMNVVWYTSDGVAPVISHQTTVSTINTAASHDVTITAEHSNINFTSYCIMSLVDILPKD
jgi:hypothetical protein